jgi:hypothetical protein
LRFQSGQLAKNIDNRLSHALRMRAQRDLSDKPAIGRAGRPVFAQRICFTLIHARRMQAQHRLIILDGMRQASASDDFRVKVQSNSPDQKDHKDDHQYRAEAPAKVMVRRTHIETSAAEKEN